MTGWFPLTRRAALTSHRLIGWIYWDPVGLADDEALGVPGAMGYRVATRGAPLGAAGADAVTAAFGSDHPLFDAMSLVTGVEGRGDRSQAWRGGTRSAQGDAVSICAARRRRTSSRP